MEWFVSTKQGTGVLGVRTPPPPPLPHHQNHQLLGDLKRRANAAPVNAPAAVLTGYPGSPFQSPVSTPAKDSIIQNIGVDRVVWPIFHLYSTCSHRGLRWVDWGCVG